AAIALVLAGTLLLYLALDGLNLTNSFRSDPTPKPTAPSTPVTTPITTPITPPGTPSANIAVPADHAILADRKAEAGGTIGHIPDGSSVWVVVLANGSYWPQGRLAPTPPPWTMTVAFGDPTTRSGTNFEIQTLLTDKAANDAWDKAHTAGPGYLTQYP